MQTDLVGAWPNKLRSSWVVLRPQWLGQEQEVLCLTSAAQNQQRLLNSPPLMLVHLLWLLPEAHQGAQSNKKHWEANLLVVSSSLTPGKGAAGEGSSQGNNRMNTLSLAALGFELLP